MSSRTRTQVFTFLAAALVLLSFTFVRASTTDNPDAVNRPGQERPPENIFFTIKNAGNFKTLIKAIEAAGLVDTLKGAGPFTLFAPTDEAFANLPQGALEDLLKPENKEKLRAILLYHIVPSKVTAADMAGLTEAKTAKRTKLKIDTSNGVKVNGARAMQIDMPASNGVIHVIDAVLMTEDK